MQNCISVIAASATVKLPSPRPIFIRKHTLFKRHSAVNRKPLTASKKQSISIFVNKFPRHLLKHQNLWFWSFDVEQVHIFKVGTKGSSEIPANLESPLKEA